MTPVTAGKPLVAAIAAREVGAVERLRAVHRVEQHERGVVAERGEAVGHRAVARLVLGDELLDGRAVLLERVVVGVVAALDRGAADLGELLGVPAVAAEQRHGDAELAGLDRDVAGVGVVAGDEDRLGVGVLERLQLRREVDVAAGVGLAGRDRPAERAERVVELLGEALRVGLLLVVEDADALRVQVVVRELRDDVALEAVDEADAQDHVADLGDALVRRRRRDHRHAVLLRDRAARHRQARRDLAEHGLDVVVGDEPRHRGAGLLRLAGIVERDELDRPAVDAALGVALVEREPDRLVGRLPERRLRAGHRAVVADHDRPRAGVLRDRGRHPRRQLIAGHRHQREHDDRPAHPRAWVPRETRPVNGLPRWIPGSERGTRGPGE